MTSKITSASGPTAMFTIILIGNNIEEKLQVMILDLHKITEETLMVRQHSNLFSMGFRGVIWNWMGVLT